MSSGVHTKGFSRIFLKERAESWNSLHKVRTSRTMDHITHWNREWRDETAYSIPDSNGYAVHRHEMSAESQLKSESGKAGWCGSDLGKQLTLSLWPQQRHKPEGAAWHCAPMHLVPTLCFQPLVSYPIQTPIIYFFDNFFHFKFGYCCWKCWVTHP